MLVGHILNTRVTIAGTQYASYKIHVANAVDKCLWWLANFSTII